MEFELNGTRFHIRDLFDQADFTKEEINKIVKLNVGEFVTFDYAKLTIKRVL